MITPAKEIPYAGTQVPPEKTQAEIQKLLYRYGAAAIRWSTIRKTVNDAEEVELKFVITDNNGLPITVRVRPPILTVRRRERGHYGSVQDQVSLAASLRLLFYWLKSKLEAISYGLVTFEEEFLANIAGYLPSGVEVTIGDLIIPKLAGLEIADLAKALPAPKKEDE